MDTLVSTADTVMTSTAETKITYGKYSKQLLIGKLSRDYVDQEFGFPIVLYLTRGYMPGGCLTALLANDAYNAMLKSHPANSIDSFKSLVRFIVNHDVGSQWSGSYETVGSWRERSDSERHSVLVEQRLVYPQEEEVWKTLRGDPMIPLENWVTTGWPHNTDDLYI